MRAGGKFTLFHQLLWRFKILPHEFLKFPEWSKKVITASIQLAIEEKENKPSGGDN